MTQDVVSDKQETELIDRMQDLTLEQKQDMQNLTDIPAPPLDAPEVKYEEARKGDPTTTPMYNMTNQEVRLQKGRKVWDLHEYLWLERGQFQLGF